MPILTVTGHYDGDQRGALMYYEEHMKYASPIARAQHHLLIGPWNHLGSFFPTNKVGGLEFGSACMIDMFDIQRSWYDWTLNSQRQPSSTRI